MPHLALIPFQRLSPSRLLAHLQGPLGLKQAETIATNISDYIINIWFWEMKPPYKVRLFCHFQSFGFQPPFKTALCTKVDELLKALIEQGYFFCSYVRRKSKININQQITINLLECSLCLASKERYKNLGGVCTWARSYYFGWHFQMSKLYPLGPQFCHSKRNNLGLRSVLNILLLY